MPLIYDNSPVKRLKILMVTAGAITGTLRIMSDIAIHIDQRRFCLALAYKPEMADWQPEELAVFEQNGHSVHAIRGKNLTDAHGLVDLYRLMRREQFNVVHCWDSLGMFVRPMARVAGGRVVQSIGNPPTGDRLRLSKTLILDLMTVPFVDGFIFQSQQVRDANMKWLPWYWRGKRLSVIHNCVDTNNAKTFGKSERKGRLASFGLRSDVLVLTNIGYFNEQKDQTLLLAALERLKRQRSDFQFALVGWGPLEESLRDAVVARNLGDQVCFTGKLSQERVFELLAVTDIFVLSSLWEGFGIVMVEAMASGVPVITTDTDGGREVVVHNQTGLIVPTGDDKALFDAIIELWQSSEKRSQFGKQGKERARKYFSPDRFIEKHHRFYRHISRGAKGSLRDGKKAG